MSALVTVHQECEDCGEAFLPHLVDCYFHDDISDVCRDCESNRGEAAEQRAISDYYGGSGPVTLREQMESARALK